MPRKPNTTNSSYNDPLPKALRVLMNDKSITQDKLADALDVSRQMISQYCSGASAPSPQTIAKIAKYFHVSADYLLGLSPEKTPKMEEQAIIAYTGLPAQAIQNLHNESHDKESIGALGYMLSNDYEAFHRINWLIYKSISLYQSYPLGCHIHKPLGQFVPDDIKPDLFECLDRWGGALLSPQDAADYYAAEAAHMFQNMIEKAAKKAVYIGYDDPRLTVTTTQDAAVSATIDTAAEEVE